MTIKDKILYFIKEKGISREDFYKETGLSASNFKGAALKSELGGDKIVRILTTYNELSSDWLLLNKGSMIREENNNNPESSETNSLTPNDSLLYDMYKDLQAEKKEKEKQIQKLTEELRVMERKVGNLETELRHAETLGYRTARNVSTKKPSLQPKADAPSASVPLNEQ